MLIVIGFAVIYTIYIGFANYGNFNLLTYDRAIDVLTSRGAIDTSTEEPLAVAPDGDAYRIWLPDRGLLSAPVS